MTPARNAIRTSSTARRRAASRGGFTLIEALMASGILLIIVVAVTSAITAGQQHSYEAHQRIAGTLAAEEMLGRLSTISYADLGSWNGYTEAVGTMRDFDNQALPESFDMVGRQVDVTTTLKSVGGLSVIVKGRTVCVRTFDINGRVLAEVNRFFPEPTT
jgi:Tfp pilus assembly protein PilV